jgi:glycogen operon protein
MLLGGDAIGRTQDGNNNAYCQDNELSWFDWEHADQDLLRFTADVVAFRKQHPTFRRRQFFQGRALHNSDTADVCWFDPAGQEMSNSQWNEAYAHALTMFLSGHAIELSARGETVTDDDVLWMINASADDIEFTVPEERWGDSWHLVLDTASGEVAPIEPTAHAAGSTITLIGRSSVVLVRSRDDEA